MSTERDKSGTPESLPDDYPCPSEGHEHLLNDCPNWIEIPNNTADTKAILALGGLSLEHSREADR